MVLISVESAYAPAWRACHRARGPPCTQHGAQVPEREIDVGGVEVTPWAIYSTDITLSD